VWARLGFLELGGCATMGFKQFVELSESFELWQVFID
jgi:hypothetical protein